MTDTRPEAAPRRADTSAVLHALARLLEHARERLAEGYSPDVAIAAALAEHRPRLALALVARGAWALAVGAHDASTTTREGSGEQGGRA